MLEKRKVEDICKDVLLRAGSDAAEVVLFLEKQDLTRFANNHIHQNVAENNGTLIVRLLKEQAHRFGDYQ